MLTYFTYIPHSPQPSYPDTPIIADFIGNSALPDARKLPPSPTVISLTHRHKLRTAGTATGTYRTTLCPVKIASANRSVMF